MFKKMKMTTSWQKYQRTDYEVPDARSQLGPPGAENGWSSCPLTTSTGKNVITKRNHKTNLVVRIDVILMPEAIFKYIRCVLK